MNTISFILEQLRDTNATISALDETGDDDEQRAIAAINARSLNKRKSDLERRLSDELRTSRSDLVRFHVNEPGRDRYPVLAIANSLARFQELLTAVFDAIRSSPKRRYRPSPENVDLSTLEFAMALPTGSVEVSLSVSNDRLIAIKSDMDLTFEWAFRLLNTSDASSLRDLATDVGVSSIAKAHDWAQAAWQYGLDTRIIVQRGPNDDIAFEISAAQAGLLKKVIEEKSEEIQSFETVRGELLGIDVDRGKTYFHIRDEHGSDIKGKLANSFPTNNEWAVSVQYLATLIKTETVRYSTGEERVEWTLSNLDLIRENPPASD